MSGQPLLFELPDPPAPGWHPSELGTGTQVYWTSPGEIESRLDATYYVISRRPERLLDTLGWASEPLRVQRSSPGPRPLLKASDRFSVRDGAHCFLPTF